MHIRTPIKSKLREVDVVILCGGMGSRLRAVVSDRPKPMAKIDQRPFLDILIKFFSGFGFKRFILCAGYMSKVIRDHYSLRTGPCRFVISEEHAPLGTGGTIRNAERFIRSDPFLVANGDSFCPVDLPEFYSFHEANQALMSMAVVKSDDTSDYGTVLLDDAQRIVSFEEKKQSFRRYCINAGMYFFRKDVIYMIPKDIRYSLEHELFPKLVEQNCYAFISAGPLVDIGTPGRYEWAKKCPALHRL